MFYMNKPKQTIREIEKRLAQSASPIVCFSGGKDSLLTLSLVREVKDDIPVLLFKDLWSDSQTDYVKSLIIAWELTAYMYTPSELSYTHDASSVIPYYHFGNGYRLPVVMDVRENENCGVDKIATLQASLSPPPYLWDLTITGTRREDDHSLIGETNFAEITDDTYQFFTPLWNWTEKEVFAEIKKRGLPLNPNDYKDGKKRENADGGDFAYCLRCRDQRKQEVFCPKEQKNIEVIR